MAWYPLCSAIFVFYFACSRVSPLSERYFYDSDQSQSLQTLEDASIKLLHAHRIRKRVAAEPPPSMEVQDPTPAPVPEAHTQPTKPYVGKDTSKKPVLTTTKPIRNLGVNGTGQRKYDISENPTLASTTKPAAPSVLNLTVPVNVSSSTTENNQTDSSDEFDNVDLNSAELNRVISSHNVTQKEEPHAYYTSTKIDDPEVGRHYWVNLSTDHPNVRVSELLSDSHRRAATIKLSFDFPFYGHLIKNLTIATGGFIYTGDYIHSWLAATQYIAPLMANFDTALSNDSFVKYMDNGTAFTVEWEKVALRDRPSDGNFTFQATLHKSGDIIFVYKNVPIFIERIEDQYHPVKVGLSDAYITDRTIFLVRRKTIYEYHRITFKQEHIKNWTTIYLKALPTCLDFHDCSSCANSNLDNFTCVWCSEASRCSSGTDRYRQEWLLNKCDLRNASRMDMCSHTYNTDQDFSNRRRMFPLPHVDNGQNSRLANEPVMQKDSQSDQVGMSGVVAILFLVTMVLGLSFWIFYAYRNPHTTSGQILIRYRPSQWRWRRGEARYTAATIHM